MGLFKGLKNLAGSPDRDLLSNGELARGIVVDIQLSGAAVTHGIDTSRVCVVTLEVTRNNQPPYQAQCRQAILEYNIPRFVPGQTMVAVRVDPQNPAHVCMDLSVPPPTVTIGTQGTNRGSAAEVLLQGNPARVIVVQSQPMGMRNQAGIDVHAFVLTVIPDGGVPYRIQVGNPVPPAGLPLVYPGSNLPAKVLPENPDAVAIDWGAALAAFGAPR